MEVLEKNKNVGLYYCLKIITTSLIFSVGISWTAKAETISVLPKDKLVKQDSATAIQNNLNPSTIVPLLVKKPKPETITLLPNPRKKPKVLPNKLNLISTTSQLTSKDFITNTQQSLSTESLSLVLPSTSKI